MADLTTLELTSAQRRLLRAVHRRLRRGHSETLAETARARQLFAPLVRRGILGAPIMDVYEITEVGRWVIGKIEEQDAAGVHDEWGRPTDLYGVRKYTLPRYLGRRPERTYHRTSSVVPCVECGAETIPGPGADTQPDPTTRAHYCTSDACRYAFFTEPDAD